MRIAVRSYSILVAVVIAVLMTGCSESSSDVDALVSTSVAGTIGAQSNSEQQPPLSDGPPQTSIYCPDCQLVEVTGVVDGDTIDTSIGRVRFFGVDTPERGEQCFTEATEFTRLLVGNQVRLEDGPRLEDTYGRRLAYVFDGSGNSIDLQLITTGFATAWTRDGQHKDILIWLEERARSTNAGCLWRGASDTAKQPLVNAPTTALPVTNLTAEPVVVYWPLDDDFLMGWGARVPWTKLPGNWRTEFEQSVSIWVAENIIESLKMNQAAYIEFASRPITDITERSRNAFLTLQSNPVNVIETAPWMYRPRTSQEAKIGCGLAHSVEKHIMEPSWSTNISEQLTDSVNGRGLSTWLLMKTIDKIGCNTSRCGYPDNHRQS